MPCTINLQCYRNLGKSLQVLTLLLLCNLTCLLAVIGTTVVTAPSGQETDTNYLHFRKNSYHSNGSILNHPNTSEGKLAERCQFFFPFLSRKTMGHFIEHWKNKIQHNMSSISTRNMPIDLKNFHQTKTFQIKLVKLLLMRILKIGKPHVWNKMLNCTKQIVNYVTNASRKMPVELQNTQ